MDRSERVDAMHQDNAGLPPEIANRFTEPFARFLKIEAAAGGTLLLGALAALILSNSAWSTLGCVLSGTRLVVQALERRAPLIRAP
jgi:hypothetical protein